MTARLLSVAGRLILGAVFLYAAYTKLRHPWLLFALSIDSYQILPEMGVLAVARVLPWLELLLGVLLVTGYMLRYVAAVASIILIFFFGVMVRAYIKGMGIDCGCFGVGEALGPMTLLRDGTLLLLSVGLTVMAFRATSRSRSGGLLSSSVYR